MNFKETLKKCQEKIKMKSYTSDVDANKELAKIPDEVSTDEILRLYKDYKEKYLTSREIARNTHSDFFIGRSLFNMKLMNIYIN